jgi:hypothetical protein
MRLGSGLASTEFAFLSRLGSAGGTTHDPRLILPSSHDLIMHDSSPMGWSILIVFGLCAARMYSNRGVALLRHCSEGHLRFSSVPYAWAGSSRKRRALLVSCRWDRIGRAALLPLPRPPRTPADGPALAIFAMLHDVALAAHTARSEPSPTENAARQTRSRAHPRSLKRRRVIPLDRPP